MCRNESSFRGYYRRITVKIDLVCFTNIADVMRKGLPLPVSRALYAAIKFPSLKFNLKKKQTTRQTSSYKLFSQISNIIVELIPSRNFEYHQIPVKSTVSKFSISPRYLIHDVTCSYDIQTIRNYSSNLKKSKNQKI